MIFIVHFVLILAFFLSSKSTAKFRNMEIRNANFSIFIEEFSDNTYVMVIMSDTSIRE